VSSARRTSFSLATLLLMMAIAAVGLASIRAALAGAWQGEAAGLRNMNSQTVVLIAAGAVCGALFGLVLAAWNRKGLLVGIASFFGGLFLGAAAGAQCCVKVDWQVIFAAPFVLVSSALLVALNRRRWSQRGKPAGR
jgi:hypothetical protein